MTALLLLDLCGGVLDHRSSQGQSRTGSSAFTWYHAAPPPSPVRSRNIEDEHWVEYGTQTLDAGPCGSSGRTPSPPGRPWTWAGPGPSPGRRGAAYTLAVKHNSDGTWTFNLFPGPYREG